MGRKRIAEMSLEALLDECTTPEPNTGCWLWTRAANVAGYGNLQRGRVFVNAHRHVWELANGKPIPDGMVVRHKCDQPACVWPGHLEIGTPAQNNSDMVARGRCPLGEKQWSARLNHDAVVQMRRAYSDGIFYKAIAKRFGVSITHVGQIVRRERWKHVT